MHKSRRTVKVPRRKASQQNQAPTLITVRDCNSECFIERAEQVDKTNVLGSLCFAVKDKIFFSLSRVITAPDVFLLHTCRPRATGMCDMTSGREQMSVLVPSNLHLLIMGPV